MDRREHGRRAERAAERLLRREGLIILARNWRAAGGEIDLAAMEGETLVFVEVKSRTGAFPEERPAVREAQRRRTARATRAFRERFGVAHLPFRFDLVTISGDPDRPGELLWRKSYRD
ncbi:MAG: YraN family protein [Planctomycetes bacterium]|nr:YraN family protein [Planctomycetota bacterium]